MGVESGEGIESLEPLLLPSNRASPWNPVKELKGPYHGCTPTVSTFHLWNPVKELKARGAEDTASPCLRDVESGEGIESQIVYLFELS